MRQYDKIYVPCDENDSALYAAWGEEATDYVGAIQEKENLICMTIEEAEKIWDAGERGYRMKNVPDAKYTTFKSWMEYKGVKI